MSIDDDEIEADTQQQSDGLLHSNDADLIHPNYAKNILDDMASGISSIKLLEQTEDGLHLESTAMANINPQCGETLARVIFPSMYSGKMADVNNLTISYVEGKIDHDLSNFLQAHTPQAGYDEDSLAEAVQAFSVWFRSPRYQAHLASYQDLAMLALEPIVLDGNFYIPRQYATLDYSAFDDPKYSPLEPVAPDLARMDAVGGDVKDFPKLADQPAAGSDHVEPHDEPEPVELEDMEAASDDRPQHTSIKVSRDMRRSRGLLTKDEAFEVDALEEDDTEDHDRAQDAAEDAANEAVFDAIEAEVDPVDSGLNMVDRLQMEGVKVGPAQEAKIRLTQMMHYIDTHRDLLFMPMQSHNHMQVVGEIIGTAKPPYPRITTEDHNTPDHLQGKIDALEKATGTLNHFARQSVFGPNADNRYRYNGAEDHGMMPGMAFSRTLMTMAEHALEPRYSPELLAEHFSSHYLIHEARANVRDTRNVAKEEPGLVYSEADVKHGGAIGSADAVGLGAGPKMVKQ